LIKDPEIITSRKLDDMELIRFIETNGSQEIASQG
jgi:hypothetical protein